MTRSRKKHKDTDREAWEQVAIAFVQSMRDDPSPAKLAIMSSFLNAFGPHAYMELQHFGETFSRSLAVAIDADERGKRHVTST